MPPWHPFSFVRTASHLLQLWMRVSPRKTPPPPPPPSAAESEDAKKATSSSSSPSSCRRCRRRSHFRLSDRDAAAAFVCVFARPTSLLLLLLLRCVPRPTQVPASEQPRFKCCGGGGDGNTDQVLPGRADLAPVPPRLHNTKAETAVRCLKVGSQS